MFTHQPPRNYLLPQVARGSQAVEQPPHEDLIAVSPNQLKQSTARVQRRSATHQSSDSQARLNIPGRSKNKAPQHRRQGGGRPRRGGACSDLAPRLPEGQGQMREARATRALAGAKTQSHPSHPPAVLAATRPEQRSAAPSQLPLRRRVSLRDGASAREIQCSADGPVLRRGASPGLKPA